MNISTEQLLRMMGRELVIHRKAVFYAFLLINLLGVVIGLSWSKTYVSSTTILVEEKNILDPLMQGTAVRTPITDRSRIAKEVIFGRKVMNQMAENLGLFSDGQTEIEKERVIEKLRGNTLVNQAGRGLIRIEHSSPDPKLAFRTTQMLAELFISGSHEEKLEESKAAYDFIDKQVKEYHDKLQSAEEKLKNLRTSNLQSGVAGGEANIVTRINQAMVRIDQTKEQLREAEIKRTSLEKQLSGEAESTVIVTRSGRMRTRISELQAQLATLRQTFQDAHPDVVRIRHQIDDLHEQIRADETRRQQGASAEGGAGYSPVDEGVVHNPLYQQLRVELVQTKILIDTLKARLAEANQQLENERMRGQSVHSGDATLAEVTRDYQVNNTLYQELLRRREQALVSMNINKERQGLGFTIQEKAELPLRPAGLQLKFVILIAAVLSVLLPIGVLVAVILFDPRIRQAFAITEQLKVPVLAVVPHLWSPREVGQLRAELKWTVHLLLISFTAILVFLMSRALKVL